MEALAEIMDTDFTPTIHKTIYPAISPTRAELSQASRVILMTGGGIGIGKSIAQHFVLASAAHVVTIGRHLDILHATAAELTHSAHAAGSPS